MKNQCSAHSTRSGEQCRKAAIRGGTVCRTHGGGAPQVREAARRRLLELVDPALAVLEQAMRQQKKDTRLAVDAAKHVTNIAGIKNPEEIELSARDGEPLFDLSSLSTEQLELITTTLVNARRKPEETPREEN